MPVLLVVDNPDRWPIHIKGVQLVSARAYLSDPNWAETRGVLVFNLCRSYGYQSLGYYVSLLAEARGHRPRPSIQNILDLRSRTIVRIVSDDLFDLIQKSLSAIRLDEFTLSIYFGRPLAKRYDRLARSLFNQFQAPLLRARFVRRKKEWHLASLGPIPAREVPPSHHEFVVHAAEQYFTGPRSSPRRKRAPRAHMAILVEPDESDPPSNERALARFERSANALGMATEVITKDDYGRLGEFDALFIRTTTYVNHHTYRFASRAQAEGLIVIDDPASILRCTNKVFLKEHLERHGILTPKTLVVHKDNTDRVIPELGLPCILKKPDSAFSLGVTKVEDEESLARSLASLLEDSELVIAQEFLPTDYDWRVGILGGEPLYVCRYFMARRHWQIIKHESGRSLSGKVETMAVDQAPARVVRTALRAARPIGDGLYGVDLKQSRNKVYVIEVNDNPSIDAGYEDAILGRELYDRIMRLFLDRIEARRSGRGR